MSNTILPMSLLGSGMAALFAAAMIDLRHRIVPNRLVILVVLCGVGLRLWSAPGLIWFNLIVAALIVVALGRLAHHEWIGGGDAKLIGAVTLLVPLSDVGTLLLNVAMAGGLMGCAYLAVRTAVTKASAPRFCLADTRDSARGLERLLGGERIRIASGEPMPYALAVLCGVSYRIVSEAIQCLSATSCLL